MTSTTQRHDGLYASAKVRIRLLLETGFGAGKVGSSMPDFSVASFEAPPWLFAAEIRARRAAEQLVLFLRKQAGKHCF